MAFVCHPTYSRNMTRTWSDHYKLVIFEEDQNPKSEARNPKQARNAIDQNPKREPTRKRFAFVLDI